MTPHNRKKLSAGGRVWHRLGEDREQSRTGGTHQHPYAGIQRLMPVLHRLYGSVVVLKPVCRVEE